MDLSGLMIMFWTSVRHIVHAKHIGPSFFVLFINDITDCFDALSTCKLYADDVKLYTSFNHHLGPDSLLASLAKVQQWAIDWQLKLNPLKCSVLHLGPRNPKNKYVIQFNSIQTFVRAS